MIKNLLGADEEVAPPKIEDEISLELPEERPVAAATAFEVPPEAQFFIPAPESYYSDDSSSEQIVRDDFAITAVPNREIPETPAADFEPLSSGTLFKVDPPTESAVETMRKSGLAYSAAIVLVAAVVFMMILGWFADQVAGSSPWGVVGGIILGALIGFVQFFRITSQIFKN